MIRKAFLSLAAFIMLFAGVAAADSNSSGTVYHSMAGSGMGILTYSLTASTSGTYSPYTSTHVIRGWIVAALSDPGTATSTDNWDYSIVTSRGLDVLGGAGGNRDTSVTEIVQPLDTGGASLSVPVNSRLSFVGTGNSQSQATVVIEVYYIPSN